RANLIGTLGSEFNIPISEMGIVTGTAFWGFTISMIFGGFLCDYWGMKKLIFIAFLGHILGIILTLIATDFWTLFISTLLIGIANGMVEAACNPLVTTLYPNNKTEKLNQFHVWFPGGIVLGGVAAYFIDKGGLNWQYQMSLIFIPVIAYGILFLKEKLPVTERVSSGTTSGEMVKSCLKPLFIFMVFCMLLTSATELGTNQWIVELLGNVGVPSILLLVFINGLMALGRSYAGKIESKISSSGMLLFSAIFSTLGLVLLGNSNGYWSFLSAAIFALGICYFWPTMLGFVSEHLPDSGALGLSIISGTGMLSVSLILPFIGNFYENSIQNHTIIEQVPGIETNKAVQIAHLAAGSETLMMVAVLPAILVIAFGMLYIKRKSLYLKKIQ
ncbi:MAG: MFS transporter, partial [Opitutaceae bacterium]|nr:MFS transporter [Cytophagales bacterium]